MSAWTAPRLLFFPRNHKNESGGGRFRDVAVTGHICDDPSESRGKVHVGKLHTGKMDMTQA